MFLVWSLDRVAKLYYLIVECENARLNECLGLNLDLKEIGLGLKNRRGTPLSKIRGSTSSGQKTQQTQSDNLGSNLRRKGNINKKCLKNNAVGRRTRNLAIEIGNGEKRSRYNSEIIEA